MELARQRRRSRCAARTWAVLVAAASVLMMAIVSPARAAPGIAKAWGFNNDGELGNRTTEGSYVPVGVAGVQAVRAVAGGAHHSLALLEDGNVVAWGRNSQGQLGDGTTTSTVAPVAVSGLTEVAAIAAGDRFSLALQKNGTVMAWGDNEHGQLGDRATTNSDVPVAVSGLTEVVAIAAGDSFGLALRKDGSVWGWGENAYGQLGNGSREASDVPVATALVGPVTAIAAGAWHSLALLSDGSVMAWGDNEDGQLGDASEAGSDLPVAVSNLGSVSAIAAGRSHSVALLVTGSVLAWGGNVAGQLGDGSHTGPEQCGAPPVSACSKIPVAVNGLDEPVAVSAHGDHSMVLLNRRTVMAWGQNTYGQLGNGTTGPEACGTGPCSAIPVAVCQQGANLPCPTGPELSNVKSIGVGEVHSLAVVEPRSPLPELGRCVRVPGGGAYTGTSPRCVAPSSTHNGHFEWLPGPGPKAKFNDALGELELETIRGDKLACRLAIFEGEYTGAKTATVRHLALERCRDLTTNTTCQTNPLEPGLVEGSMTLDGALGLITGGERPSVGWDLEPSTSATPLVSFECGSGAGSAALAVQGSVIGRVTALDQMASAFHLQYQQSGGQQVPQRFEGGLREILTLSTTPLTGVQTVEQVGLRSRGSRSGEEPLEIKAKV
jgi:alpha-tubulin suppressor-like RCC1 family protein